MNFSFTRNPSTKVGIEINTSGLTQADNELVIIGRRAASGGSATTNVPVQIENYGDPVAVATEVVTRFGSSSEIGAMIIAAVKGVFYSDMVTKKYPTIKAIAMANDDDETDLAATLAANIGLPMPFVVVPFVATNSTARGALKTHLTAISAADRGDNAQFGSFGFIGSLDTLSNTTTAGEAIASELICVPWLRDGAGSPVNKVYEVASAYAAVCASNGQPFLPLNGIVIGGLSAPASKSDWHTSGDAGSISLGLASGAVPLFVKSDGTIAISRSVTTYRPSSSAADSYYDMQDWQVLYYYRKNAYLLSLQPRYKIAKATDQKLKSLLSELIQLAKDFETLEMFQHVDQLVDQFSVQRPLDNRHAGVYNIPVNVVPGFHNKGIGVVGTTQFDSFAIA